MSRFIVEVPDNVTEADLDAVIYKNGQYVSYEVIAVQESWNYADGSPRMTTKQRDKLWELCGRYNVPFNESDYWIDPKTKHAEGWVGGTALNHPKRTTIFVGVEPNGDSHS